MTALSAALSRRVAWDRIFRELSLVLPDDVWLATLSAKAPVSSSVAAAPAPAAAGTTVAATSSRSTATRTRTRPSRAC